ncbi:translation initiation factor IF-2-like [Strigops habroptila]|uniref:translation initiation factor IF-2-like n=1 Tax=Strigops habroptila TaxID=2489341 RepID=UPI0011CF176C|nr:translation initiation factor IF-2-like [Strigops habroptila]
MLGQKHPVGACNTRGAQHGQAAGAGLPAVPADVPGSPPGGGPWPALRRVAAGRAPAWAAVLSRTPPPCTDVRGVGLGTRVPDTPRHAAGVRWHVGGSPGGGARGGYFPFGNSETPGAGPSAGSGPRALLPRGRSPTFARRFWSLGRALGVRRMRSGREQRGVAQGRGPGTGGTGSTLKKDRGPKGINRHHFHVGFQAFLRSNGSLVSEDGDCGCGFGDLLQMSHDAQQILHGQWG